MFTKPHIFSSFPNVLAAESTREGGVSEAPFESLNLGINTQDTPENVIRNRKLFFEGLGIIETQLASSYQVHGTAVQVVRAPGRTEGFDALVTNVQGVYVGVTIADCTPILIYDTHTQAVAAIHAGWRGTVGKIVTQTLQTMQQQYGTIPTNCYAYVGTCIDECSFEVGEEVAVLFEEPFKQQDTQSGKFCVDLKLANQFQLMDFGIPASQIEISPYSTVLHNNRYFSFRLEKGQTGRMLALIGVNQSV